MKLMIKKESVKLANDNAEGQIIVSGDKEKIDFFYNQKEEKKLNQFPLK